VTPGLSRVRHAERNGKLDSQEAVAANPDETAPPPVSPPTATSAVGMDQSLAGSLAWRAAADWASQILSWASLFVIVRLLTPADFGIAGMALVLLPYLRWISEFGIGRIVVTFRELDEDQLAQLNTVAVLLGFAGFAVAAVLSRPVAAFFRTPQLTPVVLVACSSLLLWGIRAVPEALLTRDLRFQFIALVEAVFSMVSAIVALGLAFLHFGYWALVLGNLTGLIVRSTMIVWRRPHRFARPRLGSLRKEFLYGWHILVSMVALNSYQCLDNVTAGRVLGKGALGVYAMAWSLANVSLEKVTSLVTTVIPSYLSAIQTDEAALRRYVRTLTEAVSLATFPATIGLGLVAPELVPLILGQKWIGVIRPLEVLSVYAALRSIVALLSKLLTSVGNARYVMWNDLAALVIMPISFYIGSHWGVGGIAWGWVAAYPLVVIPLYYKTFQTIHMKVGEYIRALRPALDGSLLMTGAVLTLKWFLPGSLPMVVRLVLEICTGALAFVGTVLLLHRERALSFLRLAKSFRRKKA
jgi:teichuronic acid exporter